MHPILFTLPDWLPVLGGNPITAYGFLLGLSVILGWSLASRRLTRDGVSEGVVAAVLGVALIAGLIGARALHLVLHPEEWQGARSLLRFDAEGASFYGALLLGAPLAALLARVLGARPWRVLDRLAPSIAVGIGLTYVGIFLHGANYGRETTSPLGVRFPLWRPDDAVALGHSGPPLALRQLREVASPVFDHLGTQIDRVVAVARGPLGQGSDVMRRVPAAFEAKLQALATLVTGGASAPVVPSQLLAALVGVMALLLVLVLERRQRFSGQLFLGAVALVAAARVGIDATRGDLVAAVGPLAELQIVGLGLFVVALALWLWRAHRSGETSAGARPGPDTEVR